VLKRAALDADAVYFGSRDGHCYCLDRKTGKQRWKAAMGSPVIASPVLVRSGQGGKTLSVFVIGSEGRVACLEPQTGKADWVFSELEKAAPLLISTPAVAVTASAKGAERRFYFGACFDGLATPALYSLQDFLPAPLE